MKIKYYRKEIGLDLNCKQDNKKYGKYKNKLKIED